MAEQADVERGRRKEQRTKEEKKTGGKGREAKERRECKRRRGCKETRGEERRRGIGADGGGGVAEAKDSLHGEMRQTWRTVERPPAIASASDVVREETSCT